MHPCPSCSTPVPRSGACPHCGVTGSSSAWRSLKTVGILGLTALSTSCIAQSLYGAPPDMAMWVDRDGDGASWCTRGNTCLGERPKDQLDCDDTDPAVHPGATETAGDGIDSNCNGEDDT